MTKDDLRNATRLTDFCGTDAIPAADKTMNVEVRKTETTELRKAPRPATLSAGLELLEHFAEDTKRVDEALQTLAALTGTNSAKAVARLRKELAEFEPTITVLGQVKAGKTALVNAMAGWSDLLPSDVNPWTSVVTSLHLKPGESRSENGACFKFMTDDEWERLLNKGGRMGELASRAGAESELQKISEQIEIVRQKARHRLGKKFELLIGQEHDYGYFDKNLLEKYICLGDDFDGDEEVSADQEEQGRFAEILRSADLYLNSTTVPSNLCLRDTPGVNDTFMMREQITVQAIRDSKLCVVVLSANQALSSVDMGLIRLISNLKSRNIVIFVNRVDELQSPAQQVPEIERSIRQTLRQKRAPENIDIIFGSAYWANAVLSGDVQKMPQERIKALLKWAETDRDIKCSETEPFEIVWELSGLPSLFRALSERIVMDIANPFLNKITSTAVSLATGQQAKSKVQLGDAKGASMTPEEALFAFDRIADQHAQALQRDLVQATEDYYARADRAHDQFIERATQSLIAHLEQQGPQDGWKYDPTGLRLLMRSAYSVFGKRAQSIAEQHFEAALADIAEVYSSAFGDAVAGIQLAAPSVPGTPAPISLGQTIALDFHDGWWVSWWQRLRGYETFARKFRQLIADETQDFMAQLKTVQTQEVRDQIQDTLRLFLEDQKDILSDIGTGTTSDAKVQSRLGRSTHATQTEILDDVLSVLRGYAD